MPIIFGWGKTTVRDHGECIAASCPNCHNQVVLRHLFVTTWFSLFFLPVIPYRRRRLLACGICHWARAVPKNAVALTEEMTSITAQWRAGALDDKSYSQRVAAYWSFQSSDQPQLDVGSGPNGTGTGSPSNPEQQQPPAANP